MVERCWSGDFDIVVGTRRRAVTYMTVTAYGVCPPLDYLNLLVALQGPMGSSVNGA